MSITSGGIKLYPTSSRDKTSFWVGIANCLVLFLLIPVEKDFWFYFWAIFNAASAVFNLVLAYVFQDRPQSITGSEYSEMIKQLDETRKVLQVLSEFLEREQSRVSETEETLKHLQDEKSGLEPIIKTQRETVNAILSAHASATRANIWKDRMLGFAIGVLSSLVASAILYMFSRNR